MEPEDFDEADLFRAIARSGARALLIGRQAMVVYGLPMSTADYDFWIHIDDVELFNAALATIELTPTRSADEARRSGRYALEGHDKVDVVVSRSMPVPTGPLAFPEAWVRRVEVAYEDGTTIAVPSLEDLIKTKQVASRPRDLEDIERLRDLLRGRANREGRDAP